LEPSHSVDLEDISNLENIHDMAIVEDPRFEGSESFVYRSQVLHNNFGDFTMFQRSGRSFNDKSSNYEMTGIYFFYLVIFTFL
jgi:hypothetical protein